MEWWSNSIKKHRTWLMMSFAFLSTLLAVVMFQSMPAQALNTYETSDSGTIYDAFSSYAENDRPWLSDANCELISKETSGSGQPIIGTGGNYRCTKDSYEWTCNIVDGQIHTKTFQCDDDSFSDDGSSGTIMKDSTGVEWLCEGHATTNGSCIAQDGSGRSCTMDVDCEWDRSDYDVINGNNSLGANDLCEKQDVAGWFICNIGEIISDAISVLISNFLLPMLQWRIMIS